MPDDTAPVPNKDAHGRGDDSERREFVIAFLGSLLLVAIILLVFAVTLQL